MREGRTAPGRSSGVAVFSWALYDFANTIFSVGILTVYFPLWVSELSELEGFVVNAATAFSALLVLICAPLLGAVADLRQRRVPYLIVLTLICVGLTGAMGLLGLFGAGSVGPVGTLAVGVALFVAADLTYQSALVFYNALLPGVSAGRGMGRVSGYGIALGYVGAIFALVTLGAVATGNVPVRQVVSSLLPGVPPEASSSDTFLFVAALYLIFSLPAFFFVPDVSLTGEAGGARTTVGGAYRAVISTLRGIRGYTGMGTFLLATLLYTDAANTAVANMALYGRVVFGMEAGEITTLLLFSTVFAIVGSFGFGYLSDRAGPKRALMAVLWIWLVSIVLVTLAPGVWALFAAGPLVGVALGATWTVSRPMLVALSPPEKVGEFFGLFTFAGKVSAVLGPALTAALLYLLDDLDGLAYRISVGSLAIIMVGAIVLLARVPDARAGQRPGAEGDENGGAG
ncbi:Permeases of the major facilitator superfamily [Rubrobacter radiotolerans]|uniref:MFS transporter n=1 Tax=Rubrobacter radiotolerans TaxID=42256 RepID=A0A023X595_RUBRA|nr:MFS transporter [Rubrobacter radiotolerans]AHY47503.1 Permeases of the major facilitator superfamily [Rubrobacter radiotolerans]MDX5894906.1 MFS transporter [Rubrobacter radiotolerans]SMC07035.1 MFS transporter, UMF1 family [Rubrobacter radiotolerans DSM 5868]